MTIIQLALLTIGVFALLTIGYMLLAGPDAVTPYTGGQGAGPVTLLLSRTFSPGQARATWIPPPA